MSRPVFVIVSGPPASGKTTLARPLAKSLGLPLFEKDTIKERMADCTGAGERDLSRSLGLAATLLLGDIARELLSAGQSVMLESFFHHGKAEAELGPLTSLADSVLVHCTARDDVLYRRYVERIQSPDRHAVHEVGHRVQDLRAYQARSITNPLDLPIPRLIVSTTDAFPDPGEIATRVRSLLADPASSLPNEEYWP